MRRLASYAGLVLALLAAAGVASQPVLGATGPTIAHANQIFQLGEADKSLQELSSLPQGGSSSAEAQNLA